MSYARKLKDAAGQVDHVTVHGVGDFEPFWAYAEKRELLSRFENYLAETPRRDAKRRTYESLRDDVAVLAYCVLDNHLHAVTFQHSPGGRRQLMARVLNSYARYLNRKQERRGPLFDGRHRCATLEDAEHLRFAIAYVILNDPIQQWENPFCSHSVMSGENTSAWLDRDRALAAFGGWDGYRRFLNRVGPKMVSDKLRRWGVDPSLHPYRPIPEHPPR